MIFRRIALFIALLCGLAMTQLPEFVQQYRQQLGGIVHELSSAMAEFDGQSGQLGLSESQGIEHLLSSNDQLSKERGEVLQKNVARLAALDEAQTEFRTEGPLGRVVTFVTHFDRGVAYSTYADFAPAVPTSPEALALGLFGFVFGGGVIHLTGHQIRRRRRVPAGTVA